MRTPFKMKGWSPFTQNEFKLKPKDEKLTKKLEKEHDIAAHVTEGTTESQLLVLKKKCKEKGGTWNNEKTRCE